MRKFYWKDMFAKNDPDKLIRAIESALSGDEIYDADSGSDGMSLFEAAVRWGNAETVKACITKGADADYRDIEKMSADSRDFENSALWAAISERNTDTLKALLGAGANVRVVKKINWDLRTNVFPEAETDNPSLETLEYKRYLDSGEEILKILK
ncbi:MAG: ankyrin repeat domain-containing protein, partial [Synergistaceae bacterium]|nr:ankyrin repeat domain-containing protein [Synergistaceae bacterium]